MVEPMSGKKHPPHDAWYKSYRWKRHAAAHLRKEPLCRDCMAHGTVMPADVVDHIMPHYGNQLSFWLGPLQSLCKQCHDMHKRRLEQHGYSTEIGHDGWPIDPKHPVHTGRLPQSTSQSGSGDQPSHKQPWQLVG
jgi:hypothetical protein